MKQTMKRIVMITGDLRIYPACYGYVASKDGMWIEGVYETEAAARLAAAIESNKLSTAWNEKLDCNIFGDAIFTEGELLKLMKHDMKTSAQWHDLLEEKYKGSYVMDPDGWDRSNYDYSFYREQIIEEEFWKRFFRSTIAMSPELLKDMQNNVIIQLEDSHNEE
jgi:hypothetical protein